MECKPFEYADKYSFIAEWFNEVAEVVKTFVLSFYPMDGTLELYDIKCKRMFLRRTKIDEVTLKNLHKGATVNIFCRLIKIVDYANSWTEKLYEEALQTIFTLIKPVALNHAWKILAFLEEKGYRLINLKMGQMTREGAENFLWRPGEIPNLEEIERLTIAPCIGIEALAENGLTRWLNFLGQTDMEDKHAAPLSAILEGLCISSAIHFSTDEVEREREKYFWFDRSHPQWVKTTCRLSDSTCCVIKPHAVKEGLAGRIINECCESGFKVEAMEMLHLNREAAEKFYEIYRCVVPEYSSMVSELVSGSCIVLELSHVTEPCSSAAIMRKLAGPTDPIVAKELEPNSIRAKYGKSRVMNAVHCTDLPEDAKLEVEFFFKLLN